jgi:ribonuclease-3
MKINYSFKDTKLYDLALTHKSVSKENNERLEFLGDSVLNTIISEWLYAQVNLDEGQLSRLRANLVNQESLYDIGTQLGLSEQIKVSIGERQASGHEKPNLLSDTVEAIIGAIYLDGGLSEARQVVLTWYAEKLEKPIAVLSSKDPKSLLQEHCQKMNWSLPIYDVTNITGQAHKQTFNVSVSVQNQQTDGIGTSKKLAEQNAASKMLHMLGISND